MKRLALLIALLGLAQSVECRRTRRNESNAQMPEKKSTESRSKTNVNKEMMSDDKARSRKKNKKGNSKGSSRRKKASVQSMKINNCRQKDKEDPTLKK